jgi:pectate lyase
MTQNYYLNSDDAVNSRMDAWVRVERNYFENVGTAVMTAYSPIVGRVQLIDNVFGSSSIVTSPTCDLQVPYPYTLDPTDSIPSIVTNNVKTAIDNNR